MRHAQQLRVARATEARERSPEAPLLRVKILLRGAMAVGCRAPATRARSDASAAASQVSRVRPASTASTTRTTVATLSTAAQIAAGSANNEPVSAAVGATFEPKRTLCLGSCLAFCL